MVQYDYGQSADYAAIVGLWRTCFGDTEAEIGAFFRLASPTVFLARKQGRVLSMACAVPMRFFDDDGAECSAAYLYAVCTAPEYRGCSYCRNVLAFAEKELKKTTDYTVLVPNGEKMFSFYEQFGYQTAFTHKKYRIAAEGNAKITKTDAEGYRNLREMQLYGNHLSYEAPLLQWQGYLSESSGAGLFRIETEDGICCTAAEIYGDTMILKELLPDCPKAAAALARKLRCTAAQVRTEGTEHPFGMAKALGEKPIPQNAYLGLAFD